MAMVTISLEGYKVRIDDLTISARMSLAEAVPGVSNSKKYPITRFRKDDVVYTLVVDFLRKRGIPFLKTKEVDEWFNYEVAFNKDIAILKQLEDIDLPLLSYADKLRPYQRVDIALIDKLGSLIIGNEPGTGKTLECIAFADMHKYQKVLVICPLSIMGSWVSEIEKWSDDPSYIVVPPETSYKRAEKITANLQSTARFKIMNYALLQAGRDKITNRNISYEKYPELFTEDWDLIIIDEAHKLANAKTQLSSNIGLLKTKHLLEVTGTWITKNHQSSFRLLQLIDRDRFGSYWDFVARFCHTKENYAMKVKNPHTKAADIVGPKNVNAFRYMMNKFIIQRKKSEVLQDLPDVIYKKIDVSLLPNQRKIYTELLETMMSEVSEDKFLAAPNKLVQQLHLRQVLCDPSIVGGKEGSNKTSIILDLIDGIDSPVIVFSYFRSYIELLSKSLDKLNIPYGMITGKIPQEERTQVIDDLNNGKIKVVIGTIRTMSEGLNMQAASTVIFADKSPVPADNNQAISRIHRLGQKSSPLVYDLIAPGTVEQYIDELSQSRQDIIDEVSAIDVVIEMMLKNK